MLFKALCYIFNKLRQTQSECITLTTTERFISVSIYVSSHETFHQCCVVYLSVTLCKLNEDLPALPQVSKY